MRVPVLTIPGMFNSGPDIGRAGHINAESALGEWPEGFELLQRLRTAVERKPLPGGG